MNAPPDHPLVVVCGPTGSGKSDLAVALAERFNGEVVNCDSLQVFRHFNIGTAKTPLEERRGIPHHLLDVAEPDELFTAGDYAKRARLALRDIAARRKLPIVAGGTGFYLRALLLGLFDGPPRNEELRQRLAARETRRPGSLHRFLHRWDPASAARIHRHDVSKTARALEVILTEKQSLTTLFQRGRDPLTGFRVLTLGLNPPRPALYARLEERARLMFARGLVAETEALLSRYPATAKPFESLGYAQAVAHIKGLLTLEQAVAETQMQTRRYAKRQWTWFRREADTMWLDGFGGEAGIQHSALERVTQFLEQA